jgi:oleate hydratase
MLALHLSFHCICESLMDGEIPKAANKRSPETTEAWILGSGPASLAAAFYLVQHAKIPAPKVHVLDSHASMEHTLHQKGDVVNGYDQFAGCLPVQVGAPLKGFLASIPSVEGQEQTVLDDIQNSQRNRTATTQDVTTRFVEQKNDTLKVIPTKSLNLSTKQRLRLAWFMLKREKHLRRYRIQDCFPGSFFQSSFWSLWSAQYVTILTPTKQMGFES